MGPEEFKNMLLAILAFIAALGVNALINIAKSVNDIKTSISVMAVKHENLEVRVTDVEEEIDILKTKK